MYTPHTPSLISVADSPSYALSTCMLNQPLKLYIDPTTDLYSVMSLSPLALYVKTPC